MLPAALSPAAASARISACAVPALRCQPSPHTAPSLCSTQPTRGLGAEVALPCAARSSARCSNASSAVVMPVDFALISFLRRVCAALPPAECAISSTFRGQNPPTCRRAFPGSVETATSARKAPRPCRRAPLRWKSAPRNPCTRAAAAFFVVGYLQPWCCDLGRQGISHLCRGAVAAEVNWTRRWDGARTAPAPARPLLAGALRRRASAGRRESAAPSPCTPRRQSRAWSPPACRCECRW